jgi:ribulose-phosphate 3-epimerase
MEIIPAILPVSREDLERRLARLAEAGIEGFVQIDSVDGRFAGRPSWPYTGRGEFAQMLAQGENLPFSSRFRFDIDLMVLGPEQVTGSWIALGASRLSLHVESTSHLPQVIEDLRRRYGHDPSFSGLLSVGLAIGLSSDPALLEPYLAHADYVQFMGIATIGAQGQPFERRTIERVHAFHQAHPEIPIQVDGGVTRASAPALLAAGASRLVVGHELFEAPDLRAEYDALAALLDRYGRYA